MLLTLTFQTRENKQKFQLSKQAQGFSQGEIVMAKNSATKTQSQQ